MANITLSELARPSSVDSNRSFSSCSSLTISSVSSVSSTASAEDDYCSCVEELDSDEVSSDEFLFNEDDLNELGISSETEVNDDDTPTKDELGDQSLTTLSYSTVATSPLLSLPFLSLYSVISLETTDRAVQSSECDFQRSIGTATIVVWDPRLPNSFPPTCRTSILPPWWRSERCIGTFGFPAYQQLFGESAATARFDSDDPQKDDMEGKEVWDLSVSETPHQQIRRLNLV